MLLSIKERRYNHIMYRVDRIVVSESTHPEIYGYLKQNSLLANNFCWQIIYIMQRYSG